MSNSGKINIFMLVCLGVLLYILFADKCNKVVEKPKVITGKDVVKLIDLTTAQKKAIDDSFNLILNKAYKDNDKNYTAYIKALNENAVLLNQRNMLEQQTFPDTCKPIVDLWKGYATHLEVSGKKKDNAAKLTINGLQGTVTEQKNFLALKDTMYNRLKVIADTCATALGKMEKYADKIKPKRSITVGVVGISPFTLIKPAAGITLGWRGRTGTELRLGYYTNKQFSVGISTTLFKF
ncbi:MAG: hypothetical protein V4547_16835 [Bacteroidota bacterium]